MLSSEDSEDQFEDMDADDDGKVTWREVLQDFAADADEETSQEIKDDREIFDASDLDRDGTLDKNEFRHYSHPEESDKVRPVLVKQTLTEKDKDGDGALSFQEFIGDASDKDKSWLLSEKDKFDAEHDKDKDGLLKVG
jgi:Ca2+-binding EF-hand superfamily protein